MQKLLVRKNEEMDRDNAPMKVSTRGKIDPFRVMAALTLAADYVRTGGTAVHLSLGQPSREVPRAALEKLTDRIHDSALGYTESAGLFALRTRISKHYKESAGLHIPPHRIFITLGSSGAFLMSLLAAFDEGDSLAITMPCYPAYPNMMKAFGLSALRMEGNRENNFQPSVNDIKALGQKPNGLVIASPSNPAGTILDALELEKIANHCETNGIRIISDEIYHGVTYGKPTQTLLKYTQNAIVINSFSKYYLMPGWRLGWAVVPEDLCESFEALSQNLFLSPPNISQMVALDVMDERQELNDTVETYRHNRDTLLAALTECGFDDIAPAEGAFYLYANSSKFSKDSEQFCRDMLYQSGVVAISGKDFDTLHGADYVRFSFSGSHTDIVEASARLKKWLIS
jgi:aspartate/methionine/tyrosine aminotransferase